MAENEPKPESPAELAAEAKLRAFLYAERFHDFQTRATPETQHDLQVFRAALDTAIEKLAALATIQASASASQEPVALLTVAADDDPIWHGMNFIGLTEHGRALPAGKYQLYTAATQARPASGEAWISVDERLPEAATDCLVWVKALSLRQGSPTHYAYVTRWDEQREIPIGLGWDDFDYEDVTHWMPLPAAPTSTPSAAKKD